jgi:uncharacterized membrane protein YcaP (DUF421 family)
MDLVLRAIALYIFVLILMRMVGRRELSSMTPVDLVLLVVLGDALQQGLTQDDYSVTGAIIVITTIALLQVLTSYITYLSRRADRVIDGNPIVLIEDGQLIERNLRRQRLRPHDVAEQMRLEGIGSFADVRWGILESNGSFSFIKTDNNN